MTNLEVRIMRCRHWQCFCGHDVTTAEIDLGEVVFARIGGDSANGYEALHAACLDDD